MAPPTPPIGLPAAFSGSAREGEAGPSAAASQLAAPPSVQAASARTAGPVAGRASALASTAAASSPLVDTQPAYVTHTSGRPPAPDFQFGPRGAADEQVTVAPPELRARVTCPRCSTQSDAGLRYCVSCGFAMEGVAAQASPLAATYALSDGVVHASSDGNDAPMQTGPVIAPLRVVSLSGPETPAQSVRVCARCRGACDAAAQYCRFCGASLADVPVVPSAAVPTALRPPSLSSAGVSPVTAPIDAASEASAPRTDPIPPPLTTREAGDATAADEAAVAMPPSTHAYAPRRAPALVPAIVEDAALRHAREHASADRTSGASGGGAEPRGTNARGAMASTSQLHGFAIPDPAAVAVQEWSPKVRLVIVARDGGEGPSYPIGEQLDVGRLEGHVVIAEDRYLSPRHARIVRRDRKLVLRDLGSTNGVYLRLRSPRGDGGHEGEPPGGRGPTPGMGADPSARANPPQGAAAIAVGGAASGTAGGGAREGGTHLTTHALKDQDLLLVGQQVLRFEVVNDAFEGLGPAAQHGTLLFGTPASPRYARLSQRTVEGVTRDVFYIRKAETVLGRESGDIVFTEDPFLSRRHAVIRMSGAWTGGAATGLAERAHDASGGDAPVFLLEDLGSSNGTFIQLRGEVTLQSGDQFRIGQQLFRIDIA